MNDVVIIVICANMDADTLCNFCFIDYCQLSAVNSVLLVCDVDGWSVGFTFGMCFWSVMWMVCGLHSVYLIISLDCFSTNKLGRDVFIHGSWGWKMWNHDLQYSGMFHDCGNWKLDLVQDSIFLLRNR